jgi:probable HAF family extracellular repeat protein
MAGSRCSPAVLVRVATSSLLTLFAVVTAVARGAAASYTVTDLGTCGTVQSAEAFEVNGAGLVVGRASNRAFLWQGSSKTDLGTLGGPSAAANALNERDHIVGYSTFATGSPAAPYSGTAAQSRIRRQTLRRPTAPPVR